MKSLKAIIVEDEAHGRLNLRNLLKRHCPKVHVISEAVDLRSASDLFASQSEDIDLAFLDINLPDGQIFDLLEQLPDLNCALVFVTAYDHYAIKACEFASIGYLLKPIDPQMLKSAVQRAIRRGQITKADLSGFRPGSTPQSAFNKVSINTVDGVTFVDFEAIIRLEADGNYTHFFLKDNRRLTASKTIKFYEELLKQSSFFRVHKGHVINLNYIQKFEKGEASQVLMIDGKQIEVSRRRRVAFFTRLKRMGGE